MPDTLTLPILSEMVPRGFSYGKNYLVEFDPHSLWYEASLTIATHSLKRGIKTDYHTFTHIPDEIREAFANLGLNVKKLEDDNTLRIVDSYSLTTLLKRSKEAEKSGIVQSMERSLNLNDWTKDNFDFVKEEIPEIEKNRLHIDDDTSVLVSYNDEKTFIDHWRTSAIPWARIFGWAMLHSSVTGAYSENFYRQFESICDGIIDFRSREENGMIEHYVRWRATRGKPLDSRWRRLRLSDDGEVTLTAESRPAAELGIGRWLRGPRKQ